MQFGFALHEAGVDYFLMSGSRRQKCRVLPMILNTFRWGTIGMVSLSTGARMPGHGTLTNACATTVDRLNWEAEMA
jgi:hypothetical protein